MGIIDIFLIFWALPAFITLFVLLQVIKSTEYCEIEDFSFQDWKAIIICFLFYPFGMVTIATFLLSDLHWLVKKRSLFRDD